MYSHSDIKAYNKMFIELVLSRFWNDIALRISCSINAQNLCIYTTCIVKTQKPIFICSVFFSHLRMKYSSVLLLETMLRVGIS